MLTFPLCGLRANLALGPRYQGLVAFATTRFRPAATWAGGQSVRYFDALPPSSHNIQAITHAHYEAGLGIDKIKDIEEKSSQRSKGTGQVHKKFEEKVLELCNFLNKFLGLEGVTTDQLNSQDELEEVAATESNEDPRFPLLQKLAEITQNNAK